MVIGDSWQDVTCLEIDGLIGVQVGLNGLFGREEEGVCVGHGVVCMLKLFDYLLLF